MRYSSPQFSRVAERCGLIRLSVFRDGGCPRRSTRRYGTSGFGTGSLRKLINGAKAKSLSYKPGKSEWHKCMTRPVMAQLHSSPTASTTLVLLLALPSWAACPLLRNKARLN